MLRIIVVILPALLPALAWSQSESLAKPSPAIPWNAADDLQAMEGRWQMETDFRGVRDKDLPADRHGNRIVSNLFVRGAVLKIDDGKYAVENSQETGKLVNGYSDIAFRPPNNHWLNTQEPLISLDTQLGSRALFSYVVTADAIHFRYPANSCSRSGIRITLKRMDGNVATEKR